MIELLQQIPKSELHVHIRGAIPVGVFTSLLNKYPTEEVLRRIPASYQAVLQQYGNIRSFMSPHEGPWQPEAAAGIFRSDTFEQFLNTFCFVGYFIRDVEDMRLLVTGVLESLKSQNVVYAEITVSIREYVRQGIPLAALLDCLEEGAHYPGIRVQWIVDLVRDFGSEAGLALLKEITAARPRSLVGITIGGSEHHFPPAQFAEVYATARDHGLRLTVHAGEALGPESVWDALRILGAERIGHGVRAIEDEALVAYLAENKVPLEVCPTSNLRTGIYPSYKDHPIKALFEAGVPITVNSDDPTFFGTTLANEYAQVYNIGIREDAVIEMIKNGFKYAFLPKDEIAGYLDMVEQAVASG